jgi:hypothetical protein
MPTRGPRRSQRRTSRRALVVAVLAAFALTGVLATAAPAFGAAVIEPFMASTPISGLIDDTCAGAGVVGTFTGTETVEGKRVITPTGAHFSGTDTTVFRVDFPDGSFLLASQTSPLSFTSARVDSVITFGSTLHERGTLFDANGNILAFEQFHARNRTTIIDGRITADFDRGFLTCR